MKTFSISVFFLTLTVLSVLFYRKSVAVLDNIEKTSVSISQYVEDQKAQLTSEKNRKAIDAGIAAAASLQGTIRLVNTQTIPRVNRTLEGLDDSARSIKDLVEHTDASINQKTLPEIGRVASSASTLLATSNTSLEHFDEAVLLLPEILKNTSLSVEEVRGIIADPSFKEALSHLNESSKNIEDLTKELKVAGASAPSVAKSIEEIARTTSKYRKAVLLSQIISSVARAFF